MSEQPWRCNVCGGSRLVFDSATHEATCFSCSWGEHVGQQCTGVQVPGWRCTRTATESGLCWQHMASSQEIIAAVKGMIRGGSLIEFLVEAGDDELRLELADRLHRQLVGPERAKRGAEREERMRAASVVYFVEREGFIKIGTTSQLEKRLKALSKGSCFPEGMTVGPVQLLAAIPGDARNERHFHDTFYSHRIQGTEWFYGAPEIRKFIGRLKNRVAV